MSALLVPLSLVRTAVQQSHNLGRDETRREVVDRVLTRVGASDCESACRLPSKSIASKSNACMLMVACPAQCC